ncbi:hypothetical protein KAU32_01360 [bacterium]|nr:hypothetical protein [bacterium]
MVEILVPMTLFAIPVLIVWIIYIYESKQGQRLHEERMLAIEKGMEPPEWPEKKEKKVKLPAYIGFRNAGLIITLCGIGAFIGTFANAGIEEALGTSIFVLLGVAFLAISYFLKKEKDNSKEI